MSEARKGFAPKTSTQRARDLREKRAREGLAEVRGIWANKRYHKALKLGAARALVEFLGKK